MNSQVLASCPWQLVSPLFLVSFSLVQLTEPQGHALAARNVVTLVCCIAPVISLTAQCKSVLFHQSLRHKSFPVNSACERSWVSAVGLTYAVLSVMSGMFMPMRPRGGDFCVSYET